MTVLEVTPGDTVTIVVGSAGLPGTNDTDAFPFGLGIGASQSTTATDGTDGNASSCRYRSSVVCQADGGKKGKKAVCTASRLDAVDYRLCKTTGANGIPGPAIGDAVSNGGWNLGGTKGPGVPMCSPRPAAMAGWRSAGKDRKCAMQI